MTHSKKPNSENGTCNLQKYKRIKFMKNAFYTKSISKEEYFKNKYIYEK
jgi:hypothetical protein